jgi:hypothetical protein
MSKQLSEALRDGRMRLGDFWLDRHFGDFSYPAACVLISNGVGSSQWNYARLRMIYSWIDKIYQCPWCADALQDFSILTHPFDRHIRHGQHTIEELIDWIVSIEPKPEFYGMDDMRGTYVRFDSAEELQMVRLAARCSRTDLNSFIVNSAVFDASLKVPWAKRKPSQGTRRRRKIIFGEPGAA